MLKCCSHPSPVPTENAEQRSCCTTRPVFCGVLTIPCSDARCTGHSFESRQMPHLSNNTPLGLWIAFPMAFSSVFLKGAKVPMVFSSSSLPTPDADRPIESSQPENGDSPKRPEENCSISS